MKNNNTKMEQVFTVVISILWFIFTPIEIIFKYIFKILKKLFVDTGKGIYSKLISWLSLIGFLIIFYIIIELFK